MVCTEPWGCANRTPKGVREPTPVPVKGEPRPRTSPTRSSSRIDNVEAFRTRGACSAGTCCTLTLVGDAGIAGGGYLALHVNIERTGGHVEECGPLPRCILLVRPGPEVELGGFLPNDGVTPTTGSVARSSREVLEKPADSDSVQIDLLSRFEVAALAEVARGVDPQLCHLIEAHRQYCEKLQVFEDAL